MKDFFTTFAACLSAIAVALLTVGIGALVAIFFLRDGTHCEKPVIMVGMSQYAKLFSNPQTSTERGRENNSLAGTAQDNSLPYCDIGSPATFFSDPPSPLRVSSGASPGEQAGRLFHMASRIGFGSLPPVLRGRLFSLTLSDFRATLSERVAFFYGTQSFASFRSSDRGASAAFFQSQQGAIQ